MFCLIMPKRQTLQNKKQEHHKTEVSFNVTVRIKTRSEFYKNASTCQ